MKNVFLPILLAFSTACLYAQTTDVEMANYIDPTLGKKIVEYSPNNFGYLVQTEGKLVGPSTWQLMRVSGNAQGRIMAGAKMNFNENVDLVWVDKTATEICALFQIWDASERWLKLFNYRFNAQTGSLTKTDTLLYTQGVLYTESADRATLAETLHDKYSYIIEKGAVAPFYARCNYAVSPDGSRRIAYYYSHTEKVTQLIFALLDANLKVIQKGKLPTAHGANFLLHPAAIDNQGMIYIPYTTTDGRFELHQVNPQTKAKKEAIAEGGSYMISQVILKPYANGKVAVGSIYTSKTKELLGVLAVNVDFTSADYEYPQTTFTSLTGELKMLIKKVEKIDNSRRSTAEIERYHFYELTDYARLKTGQSSFVLEKRYMLDLSKLYEGLGKASKSSFGAKEAKVVVGGVINILADEDGNSDFQQYYPRLENSNFYDGINAMQSVVRRNPQGLVVGIYYAESEGMSNAKTKLNALGIDPTNGLAKTKGVVANNDKFEFLGSYSIALPAGIATVGRKGAAKLKQFFKYHAG